VTARDCDGVLPGAPIADDLKIQANLTSLLAWALFYAGFGFHVLPLQPGGKRPNGRLVEHGLHDATRSIDLIRRWWRAEPSGNIGIRTGEIHDVLDVDSPAALTELDAAMPAGWRDSLTVAVKTPHGWHFWVRPSGSGNTVRLGGLAGVDWRGLGGYVVVPGSRTAESETWSWLYGLPTAEIPAAPDRLLTLRQSKNGGVLRQRQSAALAPVTGLRAVLRAGAYGRRALEDECGKVSRAAPGSRNHELNKASFSLGQLIGGKVLGLDEVIDALLRAASACGVPAGEAEATIASGISAGSAEPRGVPA
jgi:hypothetical protein